MYHFDFGKIRGRTPTDGKRRRHACEGEGEGEREIVNFDFDGSGEKGFVTER